jgi:hypothetical protein
MRMQSGTPPRQALVTDTTASNFDQLSDQHSAVGWNSPLCQGLSAPSITYMHHARPGPSTPHEPHPHLTAKTPFTTKPILSSAHTTTYPDKSPYSMPASSWSLSTPIPQASIPPTSQVQSLTFQPQSPPTPPPQLTIPPFSTYTTYSPSYSATAYPQIPPRTIFPTYPHHRPYYTQYPIHSTFQPQPTTGNLWSRPHHLWPDQIGIQQTINQPQPTNLPPPNQTQENSFAHSFSRSLKMEFPKFDGETPMGWIRQVQNALV